jgi:hypothetical protein
MSESPWNEVRECENKYQIGLPTLVIRLRT